MMTEKGERVRHYAERYRKAKRHLNDAVAASRNGLP